MENWKPVVGCEDRYEVSDLGRVRSLDRINSNGRMVTGRILKQVKSVHDYLFVGIYYQGSSKAKLSRVHRLVAESFINKIPDGMVVDHLNGVKTDNRVSNIEIVSIRENTIRGNVCDMDSKTSSFLGVCARGKKWAAYKTIDGKAHVLGVYDKEEDAHEAYVLGKRTGKARSPKFYSKDKIYGRFQVRIKGVRYGSFATEEEAEEKVNSVLSRKS